MDAPSGSITLQLPVPDAMAAPARSLIKRVPATRRQEILDAAGYVNMAKDAEPLERVQAASLHYHELTPEEQSLWERYLNRCIVVDEYTEFVIPDEVVVPHLSNAIKYGRFDGFQIWTNQETGQSKIVGLIATTYRVRVFDVIGWCPATNTPATAGELRERFATEDAAKKKERQEREKAAVEADRVVRRRSRRIRVIATIALLPLVLLAIFAIYVEVGWWMIIPLIISLFFLCWGFSESYDPRNGHVGVVNGLAAALVISTTWYGVSVTLYRDRIVSMDICDVKVDGTELRASDGSIYHISIDDDGWEANPQGDLTEGRELIGKKVVARVQGQWPYRTVSFASKRGVATKC